SCRARARIRKPQSLRTRYRDDGKILTAVVLIPNNAKPCGARVKSPARREFARRRVRYRNRRLRHTHTAVAYRRAYSPNPWQRDKLYPSTSGLSLAAAPATVPDAPASVAAVRTEYPSIRPATLSAAWVCLLL